MEITVRANQNIFDIALQYYGDMGFTGQLIRDNDLTWTAPLSPGDVLKIDETITGNKEIKNFLSLGQFIVQNAAVILPDTDAPTFDQDNTTWDQDNITFDNTI